MPFRTFEQLIQANKDNGGYFFSKEAMEMYDRKVESELIAHHFITSEGIH